MLTLAVIGNYVSSVGVSPVLSKCVNLICCVRQHFVRVSHLTHSGMPRMDFLFLVTKSNANALFFFSLRVGLLFCHAIKDALNRPAFPPFFLLLLHVVRHFHGRRFVCRFKSGKTYGTIFKSSKKKINRRKENPWASFLIIFIDIVCVLLYFFLLWKRKKKTCSGEMLLIDVNDKAKPG